MGSVVRLVAMLAVVLACRGRPPAPSPPTPPPTPVVVTSPGPLAAKHAGLACLDCHANNSARVISDKCLACHDHTPLAMRIQTGKGFHASVVVRSKACETCHADHRGTAADILGWKSLNGGRAGFDHDLAGWPLTGAHASAACESCHAKQYMGTDRLCGSCHSDPRHGFVKRDFLACDRCHTTQTWAPKLAPQMQFDHDSHRDARMPLLGVHASVACAKCHPAARFNLALKEPADCANCHASPHAKQVFSRAPRCDSCHSPTMKSLTSTTFDHSERTRFDLGRWHNKLDCAKCHTAALGTTPPSGDCETCHANRSPHAKRFAAFGQPPRCASCHSVWFNQDAAQPKWPANAFDHGKNTPFPLKGKHAEAACRACHRTGGADKFEKLAPGANCTSCHEHKRVHDNKYNDAQCRQCHQTY